ncbi:MAG TPA: peptidylprolyl isomerase, partial [Candidatus Eisenbacteria bacterium]|nr:peptidylprolyl isomerase [Candidatus Eisenbacteria bacterium]
GAREALKSWNGVGLPAESTLVRAGFRVNPRPTISNLFPGWMGSLTLPENGLDPLSTSVRGLDAGQFAPVIAVPQGWAVAFVTGREPARPMTEAEAAPRALRDWREEAENRWVTDQLVRLRTKTPVNVIPARLEAVRLAGPAGAAKPRAAKAASAGGGAK